MGILDNFDDQALLNRTDPTEISLGIAEWIAGRRVTLTWGAPLEPDDEHHEDCLRRDENCSCRVTVLSDGTVTGCRLNANDQMQLTMHHSDHDPYAEDLHLVGFPWQEISAIEILERRELKRHLLVAAMETAGWVNHVAILHFPVGDRAAICIGEVAGFGVLGHHVHAYVGDPDRSTRAVGLVPFPFDTIERVELFPQSA